MSTKIDLLKDGLNNMLMMIYQEYLSMGHDEASAKLYTSKIIANNLQNFGANDIIIEGIKKMNKKLEADYLKEENENRKRELYLKLETMISALDIIKEVTDNGKRQY